jgi:tRNA G18 (ribose-2'-O)-methylase SpoU
MAMGGQAEPNVITAPDDPLALRIRRAAEAEHRRGHNEIIVENEPNIAGAVAAGVELLYLFVTPKLAQHGVAEELAGSVPVAVISDEVLAELFQRTRMPGIFAIARLPEKKRFRAFAATSGDIVVLDGVDGPGNIGSIIRSATAFDAGGIVALNQQHNDIYRRGIVRATAGTMFSLPIVTAKNQEFLKFCQASGTRIVTTSSHAGGEAFEEVVNSPDRFAFVLGSESRGCSRELEAAADLRCRIPMSTAVESLNVSAAASVLLFARYRGRAKPELSRHFLWREFGQEPQRPQERCPVGVGQHGKNPRFLLALDALAHRIAQAAARLGQ